MTDNDSARLDDAVYVIKMLASLLTKTVDAQIATLFFTTAFARKLDAEGVITLATVVQDALRSMGGKEELSRAAELLRDMGAADDGGEVLSALAKRLTMH